MRNGKVLVIGIDGATFNLILPWAEQGYLPTFLKLFKEGSWGDLNSGPIPHSAISWPSFFTGKNLGKHGIYDFSTMKLESKKNELKHYSLDDCKQESIWQTISRQNKRSSVINVPMTYPPETTNGILVSGFPIPKEAKDYVYPQEFKKELDRIVLNYQPDPQGVAPESNLLGFYKEIDRLTKKQIKLLTEIIKKKDWDCLFYVFREGDPLMHFAWQYLDKNHPDYKKDSKLSKLVVNYYQQIDQYLAQILEMIDEDTTLMLVSDHGMGQVVNCLYLNNWLLKEGYLKLKGLFGGFFKRVSIFLNLCEADLYNFFIAKSFLGKIKKSITGRAPREKTRCFYKIKDINWRKTKAYAFGFNQISINLKGREPEGIVSKLEKEKLIDEIIQKLDKLKNPLTKVKSFEKLYKAKDLYWGNNLENIPEIIIDYGSKRCFSPGGYKISSSKVFDKHSHKAEHKRQGIFLAYGKDIKKNNKLEGLNIVDVAPTILTILGLKIPKDYDGKVIESIFENSEQYEKDFIEPVFKGKKEKKEYSKEEEKQIEERLKSLGYL